MAEELPPIIKEAEGIDLQTQAAIGDQDESRFHCENCGLPLEYSGRGRHPKQCKLGEGCRSDVVPKSAGSAAGRKSGDIERIRQGMLSLYISASVGVSAFDQQDGFILAQNATKLADSWAGLAENDPKVRKALLRLMTGTSWFGVIAAHAMVALPILQHHNMLPMKHEPEVPTP